MLQLPKIALANLFVPCAEYHSWAQTLLSR
jgi:hypothetical protein